MPEWYLHVEVSPDDRSDLEGLLASTDIGLVDEKDATYLRSASIDGTEDREQAVHEAELLVQRIRGLIVFMAGGNSPRFVSMAERRSDGRLYESVDETLTAVYSIRNNVDWDEWRVLLQRSFDDIQLAWSLEILSSSHLDWHDLYKLLDIVEEDMRSKFTSLETAAEALGVSAVELRRFKFSANSYEALRSDSRHATTRPPGRLVRTGESFTAADAMSFREASAFVRAVVRGWLALKQQEG